MIQTGVVNAMMYKIIPCAILVALLLALGACASNSPQPGTTSALATTSTSAAAPDPAKIYAAQCANCHGPNRTSGIGPNVTPSALKMSVPELISFISKHSNGKNLTSDEVMSLANWLKTTP
jgi:mono/diheme cytochrome c family protein